MAMVSDDSYPVHSSVTVEESVDIYRNSEWWKAAVRHSTGRSDSTAVAIYLWHDDGSGWTRKAKYNIKNPDAWKMDAELVTTYLKTEVSNLTAAPEFPVNDYYSVAGGETIFQTKDWWKGIVVIDEKGGWETHEVIIYLWQRSEEEWKRRQKYTIKDESAWQEDREAVNELFGDSKSDNITGFTGSTNSEKDTILSVNESDSPVLAMAEELGIECESLTEMNNQLENLHLAVQAED